MRFLPGFRLGFDEWSDGPLHGRGADQHVDAAQVDAHLVHHRGHTFIIANVGQDFRCGAAGVADFQMAEIDFRFAARQQADLRAARRESDGQTFSDSAARARYEHGCRSLRSAPPQRYCIARWGATSPASTRISTDSPLSRGYRPAIHGTICSVRVLAISALP